MADDEEIWKTYAKTIKRFVSVKKKLPTSKPTKPVTKQNRSAETALIRLQELVIGSEAKAGKKLLKTNTKNPAVLGPQLDRRAERNLRSGDIAIEATLDLHGMTQDQAWQALQRFVQRAITSGKRNLLVITGKGGMTKGTGVLRKNLPDWVQNLSHAPHILSLRPASLKHGGDGAFYLLLRRR